MNPGLYRVVLVSTAETVGQFLVHNDRVTRANGMVEDLLGKPCDAAMSLRLFYLNNGYYKTIPPKMKRPLQKSMGGAIMVSTVAVISGDHILMGRRRDSKKLVMPGGHADPGEHPEQTARRELYEEAGINAKELKFLGSEDVVGRDGKVRKINCFVTFGHFYPTNVHDPDQEIEEWLWVPAVKYAPAGIADALEDEIAEQLHDRKNNIMLKLLGIAH